MLKLFYQSDVVNVMFFFCAVKNKTALLICINHQTRLELSNINLIRFNVHNDGPCQKTCGTAFQRVMDQLWTQYLHTQHTTTQYRDVNIMELTDNLSVNLCFNDWQCNALQVWFCASSS